MRAQATPRRRIWPFIIAGIIILVVAIAVANTLRDSGVTPTAAPSSTSTPSSSPSEEPDAEPTGCLGGETRDVAMVLTAQAEAPHSTNGAIDVAASFVRWLNQYPYPTQEDIAVFQSQALATDAPTKDIAAFFATSPNLSGGLVADGQNYYLSTLPGVYHLESAAPDEVTVSIGTALVIDGALSSTLKGSITVDLRWEENEWKFRSSEGTRTTEDLYAIGLPFSGGC